MIKSIKVKNFQSWSDLEFNIQSGITLLKGYNYDDNTAEGSGKSSILNSICWCLFGEIPKDTKIDDVIKQGEKSCQVSVELFDGTIIERKRKPNDLYMLSSESRSPIRGKDSRDTQKLIESKIGFTYETFLQSVYFAQNSLIKFILLNEDGKGKILSQIANVEAFDNARKKAHEVARECSIKLTVEQNRLNELSHTIKLVSDQINSLRDIRIKFEGERIKTIAQLELKKEDLKRQVENVGYIPILSAEYYKNLKELKTTADNYRETAFRLKGELSQQAEKQMRKNSLEKEIRESKNEIENLQKDKDTTSCDACGSILHLEAKDKYIASKKEYIQKKTKELQSLQFIPTQKLQEEYEFYYTNLKNLEEDLKQIETIELEAKHLKEKSYMLSEQYQKVEEELQLQKTKEYPDIDKRIELLQNSLFEHQKSRDDLSIVLKDMLTKKHMYETIKEGFKEVKSLAFQEALNELNSRTNYYLSELFEQDIHIKFINLSEDGEVSKIQTDLIINQEKRQLGLFSGGQTRRIMLAVDLAISDLIHSRLGKTDKLLILDEYFKDLSDQSMDKICKLLTKITGSVIMVEHNSLINTLATNVVEIEYKNGESFYKS
jgi:DNA repair exonuclease SbcCD ATPase subunit